MVVTALSPKCGFIIIVLPSWWIWGSNWQWAGSQVCGCNTRSFRTLVTIVPLTSCCLGQGAMRGAMRGTMGAVGWWQPVFGLGVRHRNVTSKSIRTSGIRFSSPPKIWRRQMWRMWTFRLWNTTSPAISLISWMLPTCSPWLHPGLPVFSWLIWNRDVLVTSPLRVCSGLPWKACFARSWIMPAFISRTVVCIVVGDTWLSCIQANSGR